MVRRSTLGIGALVAATSTGHVLYPAWLAMASRRRSAAQVSDPDPWPAVTVLVAAYGEAECIGPKVHDVMANGYPGPLDVMVVADADIETAVRAEEAGATVVTADDRLGKAQAINLGLSKVTAPVVVLTDANNVIAPGAIAALVRQFEDPRVGAVAGEKIEAGAGEDLYWRFESWLKQREWRLGTTIGLVGELAAVRTDAWRPIPPDIAIDDLWIALDLSERGLHHRVRAARQGVRAPRAHDAPAVGATHPQRRRRAARLPTAPFAARALGRPGRVGDLGTPSRPLHRVASGAGGAVGGGGTSRPVEPPGPALLARPRRRDLVGGAPRHDRDRNRNRNRNRQRQRQRHRDRARPRRNLRLVPLGHGDGRARRARRGARCLSPGRGPRWDRPVPARRQADALDDRAALRDASVTGKDPTRLRVLEVSYSRQVWGAELATMALAGPLAQRGIDLTLGSPPGGDLEEHWRRLGLPFIALDFPDHLGLRAADAEHRPSPGQFAAASSPRRAVRCA